MEPLRFPIDPPCALTLRWGAAATAALVALALAGPAHADERFPAQLVENTTGGADERFVGAPDDVYWGLANRIVTFDFGAWQVLNRPSAVDLNVYEYNTSVAEFGLMTVLASQDGLSFVDLKASEVAAVDIPGDELHGSPSFARSYDLGALPWARYVRVQGLSNVSPGLNAGFDLDAIGAHAVAAVVPEPGTWASMLAGLAGMAGMAALRRRRRAG